MNEIATNVSEMYQDKVIFLYYSFLIMFAQFFDQIVVLSLES